MTVKLNKADAYRLATHFGKSEDEMAAVDGMTVTQAASHLGLGEPALNQLLTGGAAETARKATAQKSPAKKVAKKAPAKKTAKKTAKKAAKKTTKQAATQTA